MTKSSTQSWTTKRKRYVMCTCVQAPEDLEAEVAEEERWPKSTAAWPESEWRDDAEPIRCVRDYVMLHPPTGEREWCRV